MRETHIRLLFSIHPANDVLPIPLLSIPSGIWPGYIEGVLTCLIVHCLAIGR